jgi:hypothetical protein
VDRLAAPRTPPGTSGGAALKPALDQASHRALRRVLRRVHALDSDPHHSACPVRLRRACMMASSADVLGCPFMSAMTCASTPESVATLLQDDRQSRPGSGGLRGSTSSRRNGAGHPVGCPRTSSRRASDACRPPPRRSRSAHGLRPRWDPHVRAARSQPRHQGSASAVVSFVIDSRGRSASSSGASTPQSVERRPRDIRGASEAIRDERGRPCVTPVVVVWPELAPPAAQVAESPTSAAAI